MAGSLESLREQNQWRVAEVLRRLGSASRADIARETGLSRTTVSTIVGELAELGLIVEPEGQEDDAPLRGRRGIKLALDPRAGAVVGIDFDHDRVRVAVSDLSRNVLAESSRRHDVDHDAVSALDLAAELVADVLSEAAIDRARVIAAGIALAGPVDEHRILHASSILPSWAKVDVAAELERRTGIPMYLDNDANLGALAEVSMGAGRGVRNAVYVQLSSGIGAGLIIEGQPFRGARGIAGEIGHIPVDPRGVICRCGNRGCLETLASGPAVVALLQPSRGELTVAEMIELARGGDVGAQRAIADAGRAVGEVVAGICNVLNPEMVIVGGDLSTAGELLLEPLRQGIHRAALPTVTEELRVVAGELGERSSLLGALVFATTHSKHAVAARIFGVARAA